MTALNEQLDLLKQGIARAQAGDKSAAHALFERLATLQPGHETVWLWLSSVAPDAAISAEYLERALAVDPNNQQARQWLERLRPQPVERSAPFHCPFCTQSFTARPERCARCHAEFEFGDLEVFFRDAPPALDKDMIEQAMEDILRNRTVSPVKRHRALALGYLNLRRPQKALGQLAALAALSPENTHLARAVDSLTELLEKRPRSAPRLRESEAQTAEIDPAEILKEVSSTNIRRPIILVVDDSPTVRTLVSQTLEKRGYRTLLAGDGMQALARIQEAVPDLVLLDVTMPHLDGFKICRVIKDSALTAHVPVVFLSAKDGFLDKVRGRMAGAVDYLAKPVSKDTLMEVVDRHCDRWIADME